MIWVRQLVVAIELFGLDVVWPGVFDIVDNQDDITVAQLILERRHGVSCYAGHRRAAIGGDGNQIGIVVMPGMATSIVGWRGVAAIGVGLLPIGLPL